MNFVCVCVDVFYTDVLLCVSSKVPQMVQQWRPAAGGHMMPAVSVSACVRVCVCAGALIWDLQSDTTSQSGLSSIMLRSRQYSLDLHTHIHTRIHTHTESYVCTDVYFLLNKCFLLPRRSVSQFVFVPFPQTVSSSRVLFGVRSMCLTRIITFLFFSFFFMKVYILYIFCYLRYFGTQIFISW